jgi:hypothetical protein
MRVRTAVSPELTRERERKAYGLRLRGRSFQFIGDKLGVSREAARKACGRHEAKLIREHDHEVKAIRAQISGRAGLVFRAAWKEHSRIASRGDASPDVLAVALLALEVVRRINGIGEAGAMAGGADVDSLSGLLERVLGRAYGNPGVRDLIRRLDSARSGIGRKVPGEPVARSEGPGSGTESAADVGSVAAS